MPGSPLLHDAPSAELDDSSGRAIAWLRHVGGSTGDTAALAAHFRRQMDELEPQDVGKRDELLPFLATVVDAPQLWQYCTDWRKQRISRPARAAEPSQITSEFSNYADRAFLALRQDLSMLRSFRHLQLTGEQMADELVGLAVVDAFDAALKWIQISPSADLSGVSRATFALQCYNSLRAFSYRASGLLQAAGLSTALQNDDVALIPTPQSVKTPSDI